MKKKIICLILVAFSIFASITFKVSATHNFEIFSECKKVFTSSNSCGAFCYGYNDNNLYSAILSPTKKTHKIEVNGNIKAVCQSTKYTYALFLANYLNKDYCVAELDNTNGNINYYSFTLPIYYNKNSFSATNNSIYFMRSDNLYTFVTEFSKNGEHINNYNFETNAIELFSNNSNTYCRLDNGKIYQLVNGSSKYCLTIDITNELYNCGVNMVADTEGNIYSLTDNKIIKTTALGLNQIFANNSKIKYIDNCNIINENNEIFNVKEKPMMIAGFNNNTFVIDINCKYLIISDKEFKTENTTNPKSTETINNITDIEYKIDSNNIIYGIANSTTISEFKSKFPFDITIKGANNKIVTRGNLKTGQTVECDNELYSISVNGDITGEGNVNTKDITAIIDYRLGKTNLDGAYKKAADYNIDGKINNIDIVSIARKAEE